MPLTLFTHILNEEEILPNWLEHHKKIFGHGVVVDCGSTDKSLDIVREICPSWEIVGYHGRPDDVAEAEMNKQESRFTGWKMALNSTEFLVVDSLDDYIVKKESEGCSAILTNPFISVDTPGDHDLSSIKEENILLRKTFGYRELNNGWDGWCMKNNRRVHANGLVSREYITSNATILGDADSVGRTGGGFAFRKRLLHKHDCGRYRGGRHANGWTTEVDESLPLTWFGRGNPGYQLTKSGRFREAFLAGRKTFDGLSRFWTEEDCYKFWEFEKSISSDLTVTDPEYGRMIDLIKKRDNYKEI